MKILGIKLLFPLIGLSIVVTTACGSMGQHTPVSRTSSTLSLISNIESTITPIPDPYLEGLAVEAKDHFEAGLAHYTNGRLEQAISEYDRAINLDFQIAYFYRGQVHDRLGQPKQAMEDYNYGIRLNPENPYGYLFRANAFRKLSQHQKAIEDYDESIRLDPQNTDAYNSKGHIFSELGRYKQATSEYSSAIRLDPRNYEAYYHRARALLHLDRQAAFDDLDQALAINPEKPSARALRSVANFHFGYPEKAQLEITKALEQGANSARIIEQIKKEIALLYGEGSIEAKVSIVLDLEWTFINLGHAYLYEGLFQKALDNYLSAIAIDPGNAEAYAGKATVSLALANYTQFNQEKDRALELGYDLQQLTDKLSNGISIRFKNDASEVKEHLKQGLERFEIGKYESAISEYDTAIRLGIYLAEFYDTLLIDTDSFFEPVLVERYEATTLDIQLAYISRGHAYLHNGQFQRAIDDYTSSISIDSSSAEAYAGRAVAHSALENYTQFKQDNNRALELGHDPELIASQLGNGIVLRFGNGTSGIRAHFQRGLERFEIGKYKSAISEYDTALRLDSSLTKLNETLMVYTDQRFQGIITRQYETVRLNLESAFLNRGHAYLHDNQFQRAVDNYTSAISVKPDSAAAYAGRAVAHSALGNYTQLIQDNDWALTLGYDPKLIAAELGHELALHTKAN